MFALEPCNVSPDWHVMCVYSIYVYDYMFEYLYSMFGECRPALADSVCLLCQSFRVHPYYGVDGQR